VAQLTTHFKKGRKMEKYLIGFGVGVVVTIVTELVVLLNLNFNKH